MQRTLTAALGAFFVTVGLGGTVTAADRIADWPSWRGPNRDARSVETGLLDAWPEGGPKLLFQVDSLGKGFSSVAIVDGRLYTMSQARGGAVLQCLDATDGRGLWSTPVGGGDPNCTPTVDPQSGLVFALGREGDLVCCQASDGQLVWRKKFRDDFGGKMMSGWGYSESPLVDGDRLICTPGASDAILAALDKKTGRVLWTAAMPEDVGNRGGDGAAYSSPVISHAAGVKQYVQLTGRGIVSVDAQSGRVLWTYNRIANGTANIPTPIVKDDYVFCSSGYNTGAALLKIVRDGDQVRAEEQYFLPAKQMQNHHGGMVLVGDYVYCGHGHNNGFPICVELETGRIAWGGEVNRLRGPGEGSAAVVYADGKLYFRYQNGTMALIEATPEEYRLKGEFQLATKHGNSWPHPVIYDGKLYIRDQQSLLCYDVSEK